MTQRFIWATVGLWMLVSMAAWAAPRTALVIGNGDYNNSPLSNPPNDARAMATKLRDLGFEVIERIDVDRTGLRTAIRDFSQQLRQSGGVGLFFYAGHGVQVEDENYLLPVGVDIQQAFEVPDEGLAMSAVLRAMGHAGNDLNIVILDACRNNPFASEFRSADSGLARMEGPTGSLIAYATAPGSVAADGDGEHSPFTRHLLATMDQPGLSLEQVFKKVREQVVADTGGQQVPWEHSSLLGDFYFRPSTDGVPATVAAPPGSTEVNSAGGADLELAFWQSIQNSDNPAYFQEYLQQYPDGAFAGLAALKLEALETNNVAPMESSEETLALAAPVDRAVTVAIPDTVDPDLAEKIPSIQAAAQQGSVVAQGYLGRLLATGTGVPMNRVQGYVLTALAARQGLRDAEEYLPILAQQLSPTERQAAEQQLAALLNPDGKKPKEAKKSKKDKEDKKGKKGKKGKKKKGDDD